MLTCGFGTQYRLASKGQGCRSFVGSMSFPVEPAALRRYQPRCSATRSRGVAGVEGAVKGGRSPAKRTLDGVRNANTLNGLRLLAASARARPAARISPPSGAGLGVGAPAGLGRGVRLTCVGSK